MSSTTTTIMLAAIIVAALAGVIAIADEAEAADGVTAVSYSDGAYTTSIVLDDGATSIAIASVEDFPAMTADGFLYWESVSGTPYYPGATIAVALISDIDDAGVFALTAVYYVSTTVDFVVDGETVASYEPGSVEVPEDPTKDGYAFEGWELDGVVYTADELAGIFDDLEAGDVLTAVFAELHTVTWVVDGVTVAVGDNLDTARPQDPTKDHHSFVGWSVDGEIVDVDSYEIVADVTFEAVFTADILTVTFVAGEDVVAAVLVSYGECVVMPALPDGYASWDFDFATPITEDVTVYAVEEEAVPDTGIYTVTFMADGVVIATYSSVAVTVPDAPSREGYDFVGWYIGSELIADPASYEYTQDTVLTAGYRAVDLVYWTVTYVHDGEVYAAVPVLDGATVEGEPEAPEGYFWDYDASAAVTEDLTVYAQPEYVTVTFWVGGTQIGILTQTVAYGGTVDASAVAEYNLPSGYSGWDFDFATPLYADTAVYATAEVVEEEAGWLDSSTNQLILIVLVAIVVGLAAYFLWVRRTTATASADSSGGATDAASAVSALSASAGTKASTKVSEAKASGTETEQTTAATAVKKE